MTVKSLAKKFQGKNKPVGLAENNWSNFPRIRRPLKREIIVKKKKKSDKWGVVSDIPGGEM